MQQYQDSVLTQNANGVTVVGTGLTVAVYNAGTVVLATIYSDNGVTPINQVATPIITDINGKFEFYAANGRYDLTITGAAITTITVPDVYLEDLSQFFGGNYADNTGTVNALTVSYPTAVTATLFDGYPIEVDTSVLGTNTSTVTVTPTLVGIAQITRPVLKYNGVRALVNVVAGDVPTIAQLRYNVVALAWVLINPVVGEYITSTVANTSVALTSGVAATITSIALPVGTWDITGLAVYAAAATTNVTTLLEGSNTVSATFGAVGTYAQDTFAGVVLGANTPVKPISARRLVIAAPTTLYLVAAAIFSVSTLTAGGTLSAARVAQ